MSSLTEKQPFSGCCQSLLCVSVVAIAAGTFFILTWGPTARFLSNPEKLILIGFAVAAGCLFPVFVLAVWSQRAGALAALVALLTGAAVTISIVGVQLDVPQFNALAAIVRQLIGNDLPIAAIGIPGALAGFSAGFIVSILAPQKGENLVTAKLGPA